MFVTQSGVFEYFYTVDTYTQHNNLATFLTRVNDKIFFFVGSVCVINLQSKLVKTVYLHRHSSFLVMSRVDNCRRIGTISLTNSDLTHNDK